MAYLCRRWSRCKLANSISSHTDLILTLKSRDLSSNALTGFPTTIFSSSLTTLYTSGNLFKLVSVSSTQFDFFAGLNNFAADFADVASCTDGTLVTLKGHHVCRVDSANPVNPTVAPSASTEASASSSGAGAAAATVVVVDTGTSHAIYIGYGAVALLLMGAITVAVYYYRASMNISRFRGALHEETPLFFDSDKRANYQKEITAVDQLFPSNDVVLVTWRIDYDSITLVKKLAKGAYGEVWIGRYRGAKVAVKRLIDAQVTLDASEDFVREIKLMAWLQHPKIVQFVGVAWTRLVDMLAVIEFMDSGDLRSLLEKDRKLSWTRKCQYAIDIIDAIVYLHSLSPVIIHRDLKSRNILIDSNKGAKLGDFGISSAKRERNMTTGVGTTRWLAPELARGETSYSEAVDIYSFGVILAELDTHELPFYDARAKETGELLGDWAILQKVSTGELRVSVSSTCPSKIQELVDRCTAVSPGDRPAAAEIAYQLRSRDLLL